MALNGQSFLVLVNTGSDESPTYTLVGEQRDVTTDMATAEIDASHKGNVDQVVLAGRNSATMSLSALVVPEDAGQTALRNAQENRQLVKVLMQRAGQPVRVADFLITGVSEAGPDMDVAVLDVTMTRSGSWGSIPV